MYSHLRLEYLVPPLCGSMAQKPNQLLLCVANGWIKITDSLVLYLSIDYKCKYDTNCN